MKLEDLKKELPYKWRVQSSKYGKATCVAYIDARDAQDLLDEVVGPDCWQSMFYEENGLLFCKVGILVDSVLTDSNTHNWVWKSDTGSESNVEKQKGHASDAFKRACVSWGIGRFLYRLPIQTLKTKEYKGREYPYAPEKDKIIFDGDTLTKYINWKIQNGK
tara:strand:+ start:391 stop:876 length:486 start_codon:yes stop_codon:yes gene_type:complete